LVISSSITSRGGLAQHFQVAEDVNPILVWLVLIR
jgi:hypothetical protein